MTKDWTQPNHWTSLELEDIEQEGKVLAKELGDTFIDWREMSPHEQWTRIVMILDTSEEFVLHRT